MTAQKINREELIRQLTACTPGLASKEGGVEQSSCFVFDDGTVTTFNDEVCCRASSPLSIQGAIKAESLLAILGKMPEDELSVENGDGVLQFKGKKKRTKIFLEAEVLLPVGDIAQPDEWQPLPKDFVDAVNLVRHAAGAKHASFNLKCIHIAPEYLEASDDFQIARYTCDTGLDRSILIRVDSLKHVIGLDMTEWAWDDSWCHFRNPAGLVLSVRLYLDEYPTEEITKFLEVSGTPVTLPGGIAEAVDRAEVFSAEKAEGNQVKVELRPGRMKITGTGVTGEFEEIKDSAYDGDPIAFMIAPKLLVDISSRASDCEIAPGVLKVTSPKFQYLNCLGTVE